MNQEKTLKNNKNTYKVINCFKNSNEKEISKIINEKINKLINK